MKQVAPYNPKHKVRIVTAASLFDGHDASINIMRRIIQATGVEVIHLGHDRSVEEVVNTAIQEDVNAICLTSYQGGHNEYFKYMHDLLKEKGAGHIKIFGGGGGVILPSEIKELMDYGIDRIYSPDDGREMGLQGMINDLVEKSDFAIGDALNGELDVLPSKNPKAIARVISSAENFPEVAKATLDEIHSKNKTSNTPVLGITGTGGAGKSSLVDELVRRFLIDFPEKTIGIISVDPSKRKTGGALLGDRIRMNAINSPRVYMRSLATRQSNLALSKYVNEAVEVLKAAEFDLIILETSGIGQSDTEIIEHSDVSLYVMTPEFGAATQLEKIDMLDFADLVAINKFDKRGSLDALRDVKKQYMRNNNLWDTPQDELPVFGTIASQFNDPGMNTLYKAIMDKLVEKTETDLKSTFHITNEMSEKIFVIPPARTRYLSEIAENNRAYDKTANEQVEVAQKLYGIYKTIESVLEATPSLDKSGIDSASLQNSSEANNDFLKLLIAEFDRVKLNLDPYNWEVITGWDNKVNRYKDPIYTFKVRDKEIKIETHTESLSHTQIPKVALPKYQAWGDILRWTLQENVPGEFPFTSGLYPFKRTGEDPARMFAGEGGPERTNRRFHYVSQGMPAKRLSTAFDSVTLYGNDPDHRPDIYGKIGNAGVSICCLDDAKKLYSGFNLADVMTSVSMTINGPAPMLLGFFMNAAIDQQCEIYIKENSLEAEIEAKIKKIYAKKGIERPVYQGDLPEGNDGLGLFLLGVTGDEVLPQDVYNDIKTKTIAQVRGTVQADILKEDQAQNTCIFSTEFALRLMGDVQEYFIDNNVRNFYSVSISGYHIAEAGANPISQLAFTLANGFTYVEYYLSRGMDINKFGPNLSFFFSNGIDPEYAVIGRVARKIWSKALKHKYGANPRAQMLKYHIQTSGRSLHAQEIDFNDIRTTLQALYAIYDNCNSLHTNAYDEAITTPTEESVRRAMAIQLIINKELGLAKNENPIQGSFIIEELTDLVEEAVLMEFDRITERGGVLGAMETMYQRSKIQEESLYYETLKHNGQFPIIGVNTFLSSKGSPTVVPMEVIRATEEEKQIQIKTLENLHSSNDTFELLKDLQHKAINNQNIFEALMEVCKVCSLGQITSALFEVGGQYRRNM
ncbi:methylmalonyl-CoA mutase family protein [Psychroserpens sp.]|uniref:methylmalonyl-CoA mutase family protein n=1 Tax=Psychroserpens sp. TaxID=2020870 RepID=UPI001B2B0A72|nr:methylmalonyl-CoA mutase family protein [Psychroserpens sp.]MBO6607613.1 methylmalonyl-CoA mutase family protein [Psychroserpens sp.]MBO6631045.1 methylmalonyl-CoA mutase family protein [Psychroserpens sp.]MBO6655075.1 methylmalonyl-CoA mutase family protein [Psychroserpens sp.]MBO6683120.1 methylmalonyl-CoA mutase family protein [Psychroserpens sp.]MBO6749701.1 methylmalonyl-CoA mutase family protein [Psychroserpens sp.]